MAYDKLLRLRNDLNRLEKKRFSSLACYSWEAIRRRPDSSIKQDHRQNFALDVDRILHSLCYARYIDKTQVFSLVDNDHVTHRVLHVQLVSKIGRTIGRFLGLNEDLIEAIALAHDIGHPPFGHDGEQFLNEKCQRHGLGSFQHSIQGVHFLERVEKNGLGLNLSLQVLDGILCHDGEALAHGIKPLRKKTFTELDKEIAAKIANPNLLLIPMTLEGCVVRLADSIAYLGRDFEDAIRLGLINRNDLPKTVHKILGNTNASIVYRLVEDLIINSKNKDLISFSLRVAQAHSELRQFNYQHIYLNPSIKTEHSKIRIMFHQLFERYLDDLQQNCPHSPLGTGFLAGMNISYRYSLPSAAIVRDFIAGMTDQYFLRCFKELTWPSLLPSHFKSNISTKHN